MKKFFSLLLLVVCLTLVSCGGGGNRRPVDNDILRPDQIDKSKPVEVEFYHAMGQDKQAVIQNIIDRFQVEMNEKYGVNVTVKQVSYGDYDTLRKTVASSIAANEQPTIAQTYPDHVSLYLEGNAVRSLDDFVVDPDYGLEGSEADSYGYIDKFWAEGRIYNKEKTLYSIPFNKSTELMYYNKTLFEKYGWEVPQTWDQVVEVTKKWMQTSEYDKVKKEGLPTAGLGIDSEGNAFITLIQQWGGQYTGFNEKGEGEFLFVNDHAVEALGWLYEQFQSKYVASTTYFGTNYCSDAFKAGQCLMTTGSSAGASYNVDKKGTFVTGVAPYPQKDLENKQVIQQGTNVTLFKCADAQEELFGWLFMKYLTSDFESCKEWTLRTGYFPIRKDVVKDPEYQDYINQISRDGEGNEQYKYNPVNEACRVGLLQSDYFYTSVAFPGTAKAREEGELCIQQLLYGDQYKGDVQKALKDALNRILNN